MKLHSYLLVANRVQNLSRKNTGNAMILRLPSENSI
jgi:hypothetical protein